MDWSDHELIPVGITSRTVSGVVAKWRAARARPRHNVLIVRERCESLLLSCGVQVARRVLLLELSESHFVMLGLLRCYMIVEACGLYGSSRVIESKEGRCT